MLNLLLIDDDPNQHKILSFFLKKKYGPGADFVSAQNLEEGLDHLARQCFDVILLDNRLPPYADFTQTVGGIVEASPDSDIYVISAGREKISVEQCKSHGIVEIIDKFELRNAISEGLLG